MSTTYYNQIDLETGRRTLPGSHFVHSRMKPPKGDALRLLAGVFIFLFVFLLILFFPVMGNSEENLKFTTSILDPVLTLSPVRSLTITSNNGKKAIIDFSRDSVRYEGDLPIEEAAKKFFEFMFIYYQDYPCLKGNK